MLAHEKQKVSLNIWKSVSAGVLLNDYSQNVGIQDQKHNCASKSYAHNFNCFVCRNAFSCAVLCNDSFPNSLNDIRFLFLFMPFLHSPNCEVRLPSQRCYWFDFRIQMAIPFFSSVSIRKSSFLLQLFCVTSLWQSNAVLRVFLPFFSACFVVDSSRFCAPGWSWIQSWCEKMLFSKCIF